MVSYIQVTVHPRVGGEQRFIPTNARYRPGSSPRRRGTEDTACAVVSMARFIPA